MGVRRYTVKNVLKMKVLQLLQENGPLTAREVIEELGEHSYHSIHMMLTHYTKAGLITRRKEKLMRDNPPWKTVFVYEITQKGRDRLEYLKMFERNER
jgi:predicted transcriptional regulator